MWRVWMRGEVEREVWRVEDKSADTLSAFLLLLPDSTITSSTLRLAPGTRSRVNGNRYTHQ
jgi:hypothetical protein